MTLKDMVLDYERRLIMAALAGTDGHQRRAAALLGVRPTTLHEKMKRLGIPTATARPVAAEPVGETAP